MCFFTTISSDDYRSFFTSNQAKALQIKATIGHSTTLCIVGPLALCPIVFRNSTEPNVCLCEYIQMLKSLKTIILETAVENGQ